MKIPCFRQETPHRKSHLFLRASAALIVSAIDAILKTSGEGKQRRPVHAKLDKGTSTSSDRGNSTLAKHAAEQPAGSTVQASQARLLSQRS